MQDQTVHVLLIYSLDEQKVIDTREFTGDEMDLALAAYSEAEQKYLASGTEASHEIVLLGADSMDTIRATHASYFFEGTLKNLLDNLESAFETIT